ASVAQDVQTNGRRGLPWIGGIPILGRLFTSPTRDNRRIDIVIAVTPRVLRAPAVTPRDEEMRPSGTLQSPTTGSLEAMIVESDREDQIAAARRLPRNAVVQLRDVEPAPFGRPATSTELARNLQLAPAGASPANTQPVSPEARALNAAAPSSVAQTASAKPPAAEELPAFVPAPKSLISNQSATELAVIN
ncbi:MAG: hypothetical protein ABR568_14525, partial [Pyrinomonadaceae bacterium]